jgi:hypothetical protein
MRASACAAACGIRHSEAGRSGGPGAMTTTVAMDPGLAASGDLE